MIDTMEKRMSAIACRRLPWMRRFQPPPDGSMDQADRQHTAFVYRGIPARMPQVIFAVILGFKTLSDPTKIQISVSWGFTIPVGALRDGADTFEVDVGLSNPQIRVQLKSRLAERLSEASGSLFLASDVRFWPD